MSAPAPSFEVAVRLGSGGMGDVFLARMSGPAAPEWVALKRIRREVADDPQLLLQFEREARICALLRHENVVGVRAYGTDGAGPYLALEYVAGTSAAKLVKAYAARGLHVPLPAAASILSDAARALAYAHQAPLGPGQVGLIHRDVTPDNVLVGRDGVAKLSDFGIAKVMGSTSLTRTGTVKGKFAYMAPELFDGQEADASADIFALAATAYFLLCGVPPFGGRTEAEVLRSVLSSVPPRPSTLRDGIPAALETWVCAGLDKQAPARQGLAGLASAVESAALSRQSVIEALAALPEGELGFPTHQGLARPATAAMGAPSPRPRRRRGWVVAAAAAALAGVAGTGVAVRLGAAHPAAPTEVSPSAPVPAPVAPVLTPPPAASLPPVVAPTPNPSPSPAAVATAAPEPPPSHRANRRSHAAHSPAPTLPAAPPAAAAVLTPPAPGAALPAAAPASGRVWIKVRPWAHVFFDGKPKGTTPLEPFDASPGEHALILVNEALQVRRTVQVSVVPGETAEMKLDLTQR
jgi:serine/threonine protein kinase